MEELQQVTLDQWISWKEDIRVLLTETAGNFVHIGFRLKQIRDSGMLGGAADIFEFAQNEYGLSKSTTSRFIAINEKFSEGGNSLELRAEYKAIGSSKLAEMLTLSDAECQLITERTTVKEIRELKNFSRQQASEDEEEKESREDGKNGEERQLTPLQKCLVDYFKDKRDMLNAVMKAINENAEKEAVELMNPSGYRTHKKGICFMFMYGYNTGVKAKLLTLPEPVAMTWSDVLEQIWDIFGYLYESGEDDIHKAYYGEPVKEAERESEKGPEKAVEKEPQKVKETQKNTGIPGSVATSQQKPKTEKNRDVPEVKKGEKNGDTVTMDENSNTPEEIQVPGQMNVEDYPEVLPANYEEIKEEPEDAFDESNEAENESNEAAGITDIGDQESVGENDEEILSDTEGSSDEAVDDLALWEDIRILKIRVEHGLSHLLTFAPDESDPEDLTKLENIQKAYDNAVNLAAAIERVLIKKQLEAERKKELEE